MGAMGPTIQVILGDRSMFELLILILFAGVVILLIQPWKWK